MSCSGLSCEHPIQAVLFDWNGILIDDEPLHYEAFRRVLAAEGFELTDENYRRHCQGRRDVDGFIALAKTFGWCIPIERYVAAKCQCYEDMLINDQVPLAPGAQDLLAWLYERSAVAVVTSAPRREVELLLARSGLSYAIDVLITGEDVTHGKPHPEGYLTAAELLGLKPQNCLVIEDAPDNVRSLVGPGFHLIGVGAQQAGFPAQARVVASLAEIKGLLAARITAEIVRPPALIHAQRRHEVGVMKHT